MTDAVTGEEGRVRRFPRVVLWVFAVAAVAMAGWVGWILVPRDPLFHGKPESHWIKELTYRDEGQVKRWREFGPEGVDVLACGLQVANRPGERIYRQLYRRLRRILPRRVMSGFPAPPMDATGATRMAVLDLLSRLGASAMSATPAVTRALDDEDVRVRQIAVTFFTAGEGADAPLNHLDAPARARLLKKFIRMMQDGNEGVRNNALIALRYYPDQRPTVDGVLVNALKDSSPLVRKLATNVLETFDSDAAGKAGLR